MIIPALRRQTLQESCSLGLSPHLFHVLTWRLAEDYIFSAPCRLIRSIPVPCLTLVQLLGDVPRLTAIPASRQVFSKLWGLAIFFLNKTKRPAAQQAIDSTLPTSCRRFSWFISNPPYSTYCTLAPCQSVPCHP